MTVFWTYKYIFCYKAQKCSHKQQLEQAYNTSIQAFVWRTAYEQIQPRLESACRLVFGCSTASFGLESLKNKTKQKH